ncbi:membrane protein [Gordonia phage Aflac]|nr:membrane protein [Gordonia phage Jodelie19]QWY82416.1 membrane protein [Gordonia phage Aflac]QXO13089.1 membrane protein [Gordonia phage Figliar]
MTDQVIEPTVEPTDAVTVVASLHPELSHYDRYKEVYLVFGVVGGLALAAGLSAGAIFGAKAAARAAEKSSVVLDVTDGILYANPVQAAHRLGADPIGVTSLIHNAAHETVNGHKLARVSATTKH